MSSGEVIYWCGKRPDRQGSVRNLVNSAGTVIGTLAYSAFGVGTTNTGTTDRQRYTGREWDTTLNLQYSRAREYDPSVSRFNSVDPMGFGAGDSKLNFGSHVNLVSRS